MSYSAFKEIKLYQKISLHPDFLTTAQLYTISLSELLGIRFLNNQVNDRIDDVIISKINNDLMTPKDLRLFSHWSNERFGLPKRFDDFIEAYNNYYDRHMYSYYDSDRPQLLNWSLLYDHNKIEEYRRYVIDSKSIVDVNKIDYDWLYKTNYSLAQQVAEKVVTTIRSPLSKVLIRLFEALPKEEVLRLESKAYYIEATLASKHVSDAVAFNALREFSKKKALRYKINYIIDFEKLRDLPPVTTLKLINKIVSIGHIEPLKNINEDQLNLLLFSTALRYNQLVSTTLKKYKALIGEQT